MNKAGLTTSQQPRSYGGSKLYTDLPGVKCEWAGRQVRRAVRGSDQQTALEIVDLE